MALVIVSAGALAQSKVRTLNARVAVVIVSLTLVFAVGAGFLLGVSFEKEKRTDTPVITSLRFDQPQGQVLIDRVGELSGRLVRLENEAAALSERIGVLDDFEAGQSRARDMVAPSVFEGKKPATPAGGPLLPPRLQSQGVETVLRLSPVVDASDAFVVEDHGTGLSGLEQTLSRLDEVLVRIEQITHERTLQFMTFPSRPPVIGVVPGSDFGNRIDPIRGATAFHSGLDFASPVGTPIVASAGGKVIYAGTRNAYGKTIEIDHGNGLVTRYAHCSKLLVEAGQVVTPGQRIALVGSTGRSTGAHLHFEVLKDGRYSDPALYLSLL